MKRYVFVALAIMVAGVIFLVATTNNNPKHIYLVPENFVGEVAVTFEQVGNPRLVKEGNSYVYNIPKSGKLNTSSKMEGGPVEVYYDDMQGQRKKVSDEELHGAVSTRSNDRETTATFFIGTKEQYENYVNQQ